MTNDSTFSLDRASLKSSTDDLLLPRAGRVGSEQSNYESHIHSLPLAMALLPAVGGMLFSGASVVLTDVTLLVLASVFLNWAVRLPWEWYHLARRVQVLDDENGNTDGSYFPDTTTIIEEEPLPLYPEHSTSSQAKSPSSEPNETQSSEPTKIPTTPHPSRPSTRQTSAATELRFHELLALSATFLAPLLGAYILHAIRSQLSRSSESLISDYNLSIFILAAEFRPLLHLIKLVQARTLHLQRIVATNPHLGQAPPLPELVRDLQTRVDELEAHVAGTSQAGANGNAQAQAQVEEKQVHAIARKAVQGDIDALTRAIRRYEKRATLLGLQTESRLNDLEARLRDALTLAAGAERAASQRGLRGLLASVGEGVAWCISLPGRMAGYAFTMVVNLVRSVWETFMGLVGRRKKGGKGEGRVKAKGKDVVRDRRRRE